LIPPQNPDINRTQKKNVREVMVIPIKKVNEAYDRVMDKDLKFCFVIDMSILS
jgi:D-arabinose 1-dehydrogenase-like Zn-dependent alcohol dehydrogenase